MSAVIAIAVMYSAATSIVSGEMVKEWKGETEEGFLAGKISYYDDGLMAIAAKNRGLITDTKEYNEWLRTSGYEGAISGMKYGDLYRDVMMVAKGKVYGPFIIIDCSGREHYKKNVYSLNRIAEVDWSMSRELDMDGPIDGIIIFIEGQETIQ